MNIRDAYIEAFSNVLSGAPIPFEIVNDQVLYVLRETPTSDLAYGNYGSLMITQIASCILDGRAYTDPGEGILNRNVLGSCYINCSPEVSLNIAVKDERGTRELVARTAEAFGLEASCQSEGPVLIVRVLLPDLDWTVANLITLKNFVLHIYRSTLPWNIYSLDFSSFQTSATPT